MGDDIVALARKFLESLKNARCCRGAARQPAFANCHTVFGFRLSKFFLLHCVLFLILCFIIVK